MNSNSEAIDSKMTIDGEVEHHQHNSSVPCRNSDETFPHFPVKVSRDNWLAGFDFSDQQPSRKRTKYL